MADSSKVKEKSLILSEKLKKLKVESYYKAIENGDYNENTDSEYFSISREASELIEKIIENRKQRISWNAINLIECSKLIDLEKKKKKKFIKNSWNEDDIDNDLDYDELDDVFDEKLKDFDENILLLYHRYFDKLETLLERIGFDEEDTQIIREISDSMVDLRNGGYPHIFRPVKRAGATKPPRAYRKSVTLATAAARVCACPREARNEVRSRICRHIGVSESYLKNYIKKLKGGKFSDDTADEVFFWESYRWESDPSFFRKYNYLDDLEPIPKDDV